MCATEIDKIKRVIYFVILLAKAPVRSLFLMNIAFPIVCTRIVLLLQKHLLYLLSSGLLNTSKMLLFHNKFTYFFYLIATGKTQLRNTNLHVRICYFKYLDFLYFDKMTLAVQLTYLKCLTKTLEV